MASPSAERTGGSRQRDDDEKPEVEVVVVGPRSDLC